MFSTKKTGFIGLVIICLIPVMGYSQVCSFVSCGDVNGDGASGTTEDIVAIMDFLIGSSATIDSLSANVDGRAGITISDWVRLADVSIWLHNQFPDCNSLMTYNYLPTPEDTVYFPNMTDISDTLDKVELPIFISYHSSSGFEGVYLPFLPIGQGSNGTFVTDLTGGPDGILYDVKPDTALVFDLQFDPSGRVTSGVVHFSRVAQGVGQIVPEIVNEFDHKRMALAKLDSADGFGGDLYIPTIKTYNADPCCLGGGGNVDCDPNSVVDIADLTMLIDHLFIAFPSLCCRSEANVDVDTDVTIDIADLTALIDHLFISFQPIQSCQVPYLDD